jgi:hypothetical protein
VEFLFKKIFVSIQVKIAAMDRDGAVLMHMGSMPAIEVNNLGICF